MSAQALEGFLARLYVDGELRRQFIAAPAAVARAQGLDDQEAEAVAALDRGDLELAAASYAMKRSKHAGKKKRGWSMIG